MHRTCDTPRLHGRWAWRRFDTRHDIHWLVRVTPEIAYCPGGRGYNLHSLWAAAGERRGAHA